MVFQVFVLLDEALGRQAEGQGFVDGTAGRRGDRVGLESDIPD